MTVDLVKGQRIDLTKTNPNLSKLKLGLGWDASHTSTVFDLDTGLFLIDATGKVSEAKDFIFFNNLHHKSGSVHHDGDNRTGDGDGDDETIQIDLNKIPTNVQKLICVCWIFDAEKQKLNFGKVKNAYIRLCDQTKGNNAELMKYQLNEVFSNETAVIMGEIYKHNNEWKFSAIGRGFKDGLKELCHQYGVNTSQINIERKIELTKGKSLNLSKEAGNGEIVVNLNWTRGFAKNDIDIDIGCFVETDGIGFFKNEFVVDGLNPNGSYNNPPYVDIDQDDRTGASDTGETLRVNGKQLSHIKRILVYTYIYDGANDWKSLDAVVTITALGTPKIIIKMDEFKTSKRHCVLCSFNKDPRTNQFSLQKELCFTNSHSDTTEQYNWHFSWRPGGK